MTGQHHYQARCSGSYISASIDTMPQTKQHYAHRMSVFACVLCEYEPFTSNCSRTLPRLHFLSGISFILSIPSILFFSLIYFSCEPAFFFRSLGSDNTVYILRLSALTCTFISPKSQTGSLMDLRNLTCQ